MTEKRESTSSILLTPERAAPTLPTPGGTTLPAPGGHHPANPGRHHPGGTHKGRRLRFPIPYHVPTGSANCN